jgi:hypothetical protein
VAFCAVFGARRLGADRSYASEVRNHREGWIRRQGCREVALTRDVFNQRQLSGTELASFSV